MHLGVIPDGNRRYARENGIPNEKAYRKAKEVVVEILRNREELPIEVDEVTIYLLSEENLRRDEEELDTVFSLLRENMEEVMQRINGGINREETEEERLDELVEEAETKDFSFNWATTRPKAVPEDIRNDLREIEDKFSGGEKKLNALIAYTGKKDIVQATRSLKQNGEEVNKQNLTSHLQINSPIDFVIRTGDNPAREAISGFSIWNSSYAEYYHIQKHFPAVTVEDVKQALEHYKKLRRKKGK